MKDFIVCFVSRAVIILILVQASSTQSSTPNDPLWDPFVKALSAETGRTVQDLNTLGLNDANILKLWTYYSTNVQNLAAQQQQQQQQPTSPTTTPPPLPDLYQPAYAFSATNTVQKPQATTGTSAGSGSGGAATDANSALYNQLLNLVSGTANGPDYASLIQQMSGGSAITSGQASLPPTTPTQVSYQSLVDQYRTLMSSNTNTSPVSTSTSTSTGGQINYQALVDQYQNPMSNTGANNGALTGAISGGASSPVTSAASASGMSSASGQAPLSFEEQLQTYFPQFVSLFPTTSGGTGSTSGATSSPNPGASSASSAGDAPSANTEQMIFDALLFGEPPKQTPQTSATSSSSTSSSSSAPASASQSGGVSPAATTSPQQPVNSFMNMISGKPNNGGGNMLTNHIENVMKTRASRDMGCRFLPELLDMDLMPHSPINCLHKCPPPYINNQRFGIYCLCCPPGVNSNVANAMSIFKRASYMESPFTVVSKK